MAVQILYQQNFLKNEKTFDELKNDLVENYLFCDTQEPTSFAQKIDEDFLNNLLTASKLDEGKIDLEIAEFLQDEANLARLEEIVEILSSQKINLDSMIEMHEEGSALKEHCAKRLEEAQMKIETVSKKPKSES